MKLIIQILIGAAVLIGALWVLHLIGAIVGLLAGLLLSGVIGAIVYGVVAGSIKERDALRKRGSTQRQLDHRANKELNRIERQMKDS